MENPDMKNLRTIRQLAASAAFLAIAAPALAPAPASAQELSDDWKFRGSIYLWTPTISGTARLPRNNTADFDLPFHEVWDSLKMGGMGNIEAQKGRWGGFADFIYLNLGAAAATSRNHAIDAVPVPATVDLNANVDLKGVISTFGGSYRVQAEPGSSIDVVAGLRYLWLDVALNHSLDVDFGPFAGPARTGSRKGIGRTWDGIVGVKGREAFGERREWFIPYYADVGTGESNYTYQASVGVGYTFSWGEAVVSWRYLTWKQSGDVVDKLTVNGPQFALAFRW
jgi:hypothetical protein